MTTLPLFWHLSSATKKKRLDASIKLVSSLEQFQAKFIPKDLIGSDVEQEDDVSAQKTDLLEALNAQDVSYSIRRLIRGLASPRESSRLGFAVALTELLSRITTVTCVQIVMLIMDGTKVQGSMTGQDERDVLFARLFGITAVVQSGLLIRAGALTTSPSTATEISSLSGFENIIKELLALGEKKSWLRESSWWTMGLALNAVHDSTVAWKSEAIDFLLQCPFVDYKTWSPEKVALTLQMQEMYSSYDWSQYLCPPFKDPFLLHSSNLQLLARILKESGAHDEDDKEPTKASAGSWKPDLHYVWNIILDYCLPKSGSNARSNKFQEFYRVVVDESLFASTSSSERKYWGFQVFKRALSQATQTTVPMLFTQNFMRCWINHLSNQDRYLHKIATQAAIEVHSFVQRNPHLGFTLITVLTGVHGHQQFDRLTKTKTVASILTAMDEPGIQNYVDNLYSQFNVSEADDRSDMTAIVSRRKWIIDQLGALVHNHSVPKSDEWVASVLTWLTVHGFFVAKKKSSKSLFHALHSPPRPSLSDELSQISRDRLLTALGDLSLQSAITKTGEKSSKMTGAASDGELWISKVFKTIDKLEADVKHVELRVQVPSEVRELQIKARKALSRLQKNESTDARKGAEWLLLLTLFQSYCGARKAAEELEACIDGVSRLFASGKRKTQGSDDEKEEVQEPIDVLVDLVIGFMEQSSGYLRTIGNQAFALLSSAIKQSTIDLILMQLERRRPSEDEDDGESSDIDVVDDASSAESESESEDSEADSENDEPDLELRNKIEEALRSSGAQRDEDEDDEELMDDDQMMAIDEQLSMVFRSSVGVKKKDLSAQREATHFKNRVLDLVDTFLKRQPTSPLNILLINPLVEILTGSSADEQQLVDKTRGILRTRFGKSKDIPANVDLENLKSVLNMVHTQARKSSQFLPSLTQCSIYLARIMLHHDAKDALLAIYRQSLIDFFARKKSALKTAFFQEFIQRFSSTAWYLAGDLVDSLTKTVNSYRQCQGFHLIEMLLNSLPSLEESPIDIAPFMPKLSQALLLTIQCACNDENSLSAAQLKGLLKVALSAIRQSKRRGAIDTGVWGTSSWVSLQGKLEASPRFKSSIGLIKMCNQIVQTPNVGQNGEQKDGSKRKAQDSIEEQPSFKPKRKRRKEGNSVD
ncbi:hypothetical protein M378DRAFT_190984 [Amanita muscaria Koide BX008]|uniref:DNA polymerase V n=1 Tax=Amanita muscaria (strain Koide BX008) TaxID=946122 RepID=A0A0C2TN43_AMAMK|nr:hypothetical protein M378DRAFT_190984 [Amanita muscaria Koide BX008]